MTKEQFVKVVAERIEESQKRTMDILDAIIDEMENTVIQEGRFALTGHFSINLKRGKAGGAMLGDGEDITFVTPVFKTGQKFKTRINTTLADKSEAKRIHAMLDEVDDKKAVMSERMKAIQDGSYVKEDTEEAEAPKKKSTKKATSKKATSKKKKA